MFWSDKLEGSRWYMQHACPGVTQHVLVIKCLLWHILSWHNIVSPPSVFLNQIFVSLPQFGDLRPNFLPSQSAYKRSQAKWEDICLKWIFSEFEWVFCALLLLEVTWHLAESETWWWISREQRRSNQAGLSSHQTMLGQEETMCRENNVKYLMQMIVCFWPTVHKISAHIHFFLQSNPCTLDPRKVFFVL